MSTTPPNTAESSSGAPREELPLLGEEGNDGDRISVTDVNGTVARFEMAYSPAESDRFRFGPPVRQWIPSLLFFAAAIAMVSTVIVGQGSSTSALSQWLAAQDHGRPISSLTLAIIVLISALGTVLRAQMRGVIVRGDGVEARYVLALGVPRIRKWTWAQVERIVVDEQSVMFELWNGEYERLPPVRDVTGLRDLLERIAAARKIRVTTLPHVSSSDP
jgi:hypothetical protein